MANPDELVGELEQTMLRRFCQGQNLRVLFSRQHIPEVLENLIPAFETAFKNQKRGTLFSDSLALARGTLDEDGQVPSSCKQSDLPDDVYLLLQDWVMTHDESCDVQRLCPRGVFLHHLDHLGKTFQVFSRSRGESTVVFRSSDMDWSVANIRNIFTHSRRCKSEVIDSTFFVVNAYVSLSNQDSKLDQYRIFPYSTGGRLFYDHFLPSPVILEKREVLCHSAAIPDLEVEGITSRCIWVLPLSKVPI